MRAVIVSNKDIADILAMSAENLEQAQLIKDMIKTQGESLASYIYSLMTTYMVNYLPIYETMDNVRAHNEVYNRFEAVAGKLDMVNQDVLSVNHVEAILGDPVSPYTIDSTIYDDCIKQLEDYYTELYGNHFVSDNMEFIVDNLEEVVSTLSYTVKELEARYLRHNDHDNDNSHVLFGLKDNKVVILVD